MTIQQLYLLLSHYLQKEPNIVLVHILYKELKEQDKALNMLHIVIVARYEQLELIFKLLKLKLRRYKDRLMTKQQLYLLLAYYLQKEPNDILVNILYKELKEQDKALNMLHIVIVARYKRLELIFKLLKLKLRRYLEGNSPIPELVELLFAELHEAKNPANWLDTQVFDRYEELAYYFEG